jgi:protein involved in polysaccharide export with SLBB domain
MPMTFSTAATPALRRWRATLSTTTLALALGVMSQAAVAQFSGNTDNDLTSSSTTDVSNVNAGNVGVDSSAQSANGAASQLRQPGGNNRATSSQYEPVDPYYRRQAYQPGEFELYVQRRFSDLQAQSAPVPTSQDSDSTQPGANGANGVNGANGANGSTSPSLLRLRKPTIRRFGADLVTDPSSFVSQDPLPSVPADYIVRPGDELQVTIWGSADADLRLTVDRTGNIAVPRVGSIHVAGLRYSELDETLKHRVGQTFKNFQLSATLGQVRPIRVFVGGYIQRPGSVTVNGLASVLHVLMRVGGPSAAGSFRDVHLSRNGKEIGVFDLYDLLLKGSRAADQFVEPDDVIFVGPIGTQVAILGSVNQQAIYELKSGETLDDVLRMAGGFNAVADRSRVAIERLADRNTGHLAELKLPSHGRDALDTGDVVRVFSAITASLPQGVQNQHVRVEGEVAHPGDFILPPGSHIDDALRAAGGMTAAAYPFGTEFARESVRKTQLINYERALRDLETDISKNQANQRVTSTEELATQSATAQTSARLLDRLRQVKPTGRVVLQLLPDATALPDLALEDGDTINIPPRSSSVGVFGSVFNTGSYVFESGHTTKQYLALAGGPTRGADRGSIFMLRANGSVISAQQGSSFWHSDNNLSDAVVEPGDTLFVPEELGKASFVQGAKDWTQILYQFGLGLAGIKSLGL